MEIKITKKKSAEDEITITCGKSKLSVFEKSSEWNTDGINNFLIEVATAIPDFDKFELKYDEELNEESPWWFVVKLFEEFVNEYNNLVDVKQNNN